MMPNKGYTTTNAMNTKLLYTLFYHLQKDTLQVPFLIIYSLILILWLSFIRSLTWDSNNYNIMTALTTQYGHKVRNQFYTFIFL